MRASWFVLACVSGSLLACVAGLEEDSVSNEGALAPGATTACAPAPVCDGTQGPPVGVARPWRHFGSDILNALGSHHRGRDRIVPPGEPQWVIGKFTYGPDKDLKDEE